MRSEDIKWKLLVKHLSQETSLEEEARFTEMLNNDSGFAGLYEEVSEIWNNLQNNAPDFDKARVRMLTEEKINTAKQTLIRRNILKYAAIFIGILMVFGIIAWDANNTKTIIAKNGNIKAYELADGSIVNLRKGAEIEVSASRFFDFNRKIKLLKGEAFFEIKKDHGKGFEVLTPNFTINVLGTKFDVVSGGKLTEVVLAEGKVVLDNFKNKSLDGVSMKPGEEVSYCTGCDNVVKTKVNPAIYTLWMGNKLEFKKFTVDELAVVFNKYFHKQLLINDKIIGGKHIGGSAPNDDINLIIKALSDILHRNIIQRNDSIIIE